MGTCLLPHYWMEEMRRWERPKRVRHILRGAWVSGAVGLVCDFGWTTVIE